MSTDPTLAAPLVLVNTALVVLNSVLVGWLLFGGQGGDQTTALDTQAQDTVESVAETTTPVTLPAAGLAAKPLGRVPTPPPPTGTTTGPSADELAAFVDSVLDPLRQGLSAKQDGASGSLPSDADVAACKAAGDLSAAPCPTVLARLKAGYSQQGMPFPDPPGSADIPELDQASAAALASSPTPDGATAAAAVAATASNSDATDEERELVRQWVDLNIIKLTRAAGGQGLQARAVKPPDEVVAAAVASGSLTSPAGKVVVDSIRATHLRLGLDFAEPETR